MRFIVCQIISRRLDGISFPRILQLLINTVRRTSKTLIKVLKEMFKTAQWEQGISACMFCYLHETGATPLPILGTNII